MRKSNVIGIKDTLECRKNYLIVLRQNRERMEQFHYGSPDGGRFTVIDVFLTAWSEFHVPALQAFSPALHVRCISRKKGFKGVYIK